MLLSGTGVRRAAVVCGPLLFSLAASPAWAQTAPKDRVANIVANGAIGSVVAVTHALIRGRSPWKAIAPGFGGGAVMGLGKQVAASRVFGAGLLGRQVSAVGVGVVELAARDTMIFRGVLGPVTLEIRPRAEDRVRPRLNVIDAASMVVYAVKRDARLDLPSSISSGAPVFRMPIARMEFDGGVAEGFQHTGVILIAEELSADAHHRRVIIAHETVHLLQEDALSYLVGLPLERALIRRLPLGHRAPSLLEVGAFAPLGVIAASMRMRYERRPWEREAYLLSEGHGPR